MRTPEKLMLGAIAAVGSALVLFAQKEGAEAPEVLGPVEPREEVKPILLAAEQSLAEWRNLTENDAAAEPLLLKYWQTAGVEDARAKFGPTWKEKPWSAAWLTHVVNKGKPGSLLKTAAHWDYARAGMEKPAQGYETFPAETLAIQPGDILIRWRTMPSDYHHLRTSGFRPAHGDLVMSVTRQTGMPPIALGMGGNKLNRVGLERYDLQQDGKLQPSRVFAVMRLKPELIA